MSTRIEPSSPFLSKINSVFKFNIERANQKSQLFRITNEARFLFLAAMVGLLTGTSVSLFKLGTDLVKNVLYSSTLLGGLSPAVSMIVVPLIPLLGALIVVGVRKLMPNKSFGPGLGGLVAEVENGASFSFLRAIGKAISAVFTLGTGNSLGPEGPAVEIGVASSRLVCFNRELATERRRMLLLAGSAAGVAAGFNAPIAGVFFSLEIIGDSFSRGSTFNKSSVASTLLCASISAIVARIGLKAEHALRPAPYIILNPLSELPLFLGLGMISGLVAVTFKFFMEKSKEFFKKSEGLPNWSKPMVGSLITGVVGIQLPQILFFGYEMMDNLLANTSEYGLFKLAQLCIVKAMVTAICFGSGLVGGTFAPSLFLGATAGAFYQKVLIILSSLPVLSFFTTISAAPAYAMVGAAAVLAAVYRAPLTSTLLLFELTKDYDIVLPLMASAGVASLMMELFQKVKAQPEESSDNVLPPIGYIEMGMSSSAKRKPIMNSLTADKALLPNVLVVHSKEKIDQTADLLYRFKQDVGVVVDGDVEVGKERLVSVEDLVENGGIEIKGIVSLVDLLKATENGGGDAETVGEICSTEFLSIRDSESLLTAAEKLETSGFRYIPVLRTEDSEKCIGLVCQWSIRTAVRLREAMIAFQK